MPRNVIIMGAAGRDFHNFNLLYREDSRYRVVAFTAAQIPAIAGRTYPAELAGKFYPDGIPIHAEGELAALMSRYRPVDVVFSYSDLAYVELMHKAAEVSALGGRFVLPGAAETMLDAAVPVISVCAVRTGCGKSPVTRHLVALLNALGLRVVVVRHPMPYGDLSRQQVQRFATRADLTAQECTIEEREEYEPLLALGSVVYAGIDYRRILERAQAEADLLIWDGGNNDTPFFRPDLHIVLCDPHRAGHELSYYPGEVNLRLADIVVISKIDSASPEQCALVRRNIAQRNPAATVVAAELQLEIATPQRISGKRVLVVEDGPSLTHGGMGFGAGLLAARRYGAQQIVDPRSAAVGSIRTLYQDYPHLGPVLPAMGYSRQQVAELRATIAACDYELLLCATPMDLSRVIDLERPWLRVGYGYHDHGEPTLAPLVRAWVERRAREGGR